MKNCMMLVLSIVLLSAFTLPETGKDLEKISEKVVQFSKSADQRQMKAMDAVLHPKFRAVVNRLFGSEEVSTMDKTVYLDLLKKGTIGGDDRKVTIHAINFEGNNAVVSATFEGQELVFKTFIQLVKDASGEWQVISDMPNIQKK